MTVLVSNTLQIAKFMTRRRRQGARHVLMETTGMGLFAKAVQVLTLIVSYAQMASFVMNAILT